MVRGNMGLKALHKIGQDGRSRYSYSASTFEFQWFGRIDQRLNGPRTQHAEKGESTDYAANRQNVSAKRGAVFNETENQRPTKAHQKKERRQSLEMVF